MKVCKLKTKQILSTQKMAHIFNLAMKIVPLLERKVLYLAYVENVRLNDICRRLKLQKKEAIRLRSKGIEHFKNNLATIYKVQKVSKGGGRK